MAGVYEINIALCAAVISIAPAKVSEAEKKQPERKPNVLILPIPVKEKWF